MLTLRLSWKIVDYPRQLAGSNRTLGGVGKVEVPLCSHDDEGCAAFLGVRLLLLEHLQQSCFADTAKSFSTSVPKQKAPY